MQYLLIIAPFSLRVHYVDVVVVNKRGISPRKSLEFGAQIPEVGYCTISTLSSQMRNIGL